MVKMSYFVIVGPPGSPGLDGKRGRKGDKVSVTSLHFSSLETKDIQKLALL